MFQQSMLGAVSPVRRPPARLSRRHPWYREGRLPSARRKLGVDRVSRESSRARPLEQKIRQHSNSNPRSRNQRSSPNNSPRYNLTSSNSKYFPNNNLRRNNREPTAGLNLGTPISRLAFPPCAHKPANR